MLRDGHQTHHAMLLLANRSDPAVQTALEPLRGQVHGEYGQELTDVLLVAFPNVEALRGRCASWTTSDNGRTASSFSPS